MCILYFNNNLPTNQGRPLKLLCTVTRIKEAEKNMVMFGAFLDMEEAFDITSHMDFKKQCQKSLLKKNPLCKKMGN
jgi:hypothetical protein